jgi:hypothetical protein
MQKINSLKADFHNSIKTDDEHDDGGLIIAIDSTGIRVTNSGQWMSDKCGDAARDKKKRGYLKIHIAMDTKTMEILALEVTDEKAHDGTMMKKLVKHVWSTRHHHKEKVKSVFADGAYDSNGNFRFLNDGELNPSSG